MESSGQPDRIQAAPPTWELLSERYKFERREAVEVKGKRPMTTYLLVA